MENNLRDANIEGRKHSVELFNQHGFYVLENKGDCYPIQYQKDESGQKWILKEYSKQSLKNKYPFLKFEERKSKRGKPKVIHSSDAWFEDVDRNELSGITFKPNNDNFFVNGELNLWKRPDLSKFKGKSTCKIYLDHVKDNICKGNIEYYEYLLDWMANVIQNPQNKIGITPVVIGRQGTGKGQFVNHFGKLFGQHFVTTSDKGIFGQFNGQLQGTILMNLDEIQFSKGESNNINKFKNYITESTINIEDKFEKSVQMPNCTHFICTSNENKAVLPDKDDRRFFILTCGEDRKEDYQYFEDMKNDMETGGYPDLYKFLSERKIRSNDKLRKMPITVDSFHVKLASFDAFEHWWFELLQKGINNYEYEVDDPDSKPWLQSVKADDFHRMYSDMGGRLCDSLFGKRVKDLNIEKKQVRLGRTNRRVNKYIFGELDQLRDDFLEKMKVNPSEFDWDIGDYKKVKPKAEPEETMTDLIEKEVA